MEKAQKMPSPLFSASRIFPRRALPKPKPGTRLPAATCATRRVSCRRSPLRIVLQPGQTIAPGERNLHVYLVQAMLQALGQCYANASPPAVTGVLDASTQRAVRSLQALFGHEQTGVIDHRFWAYLTRLYTLSAGDGTQSASSGAAPAAKYLL